jgi:hypothetical protein
MMWMDIDHCKSVGVALAGDLNGDGRYEDRRPGWDFGEGGLYPCFFPGRAGRLQGRPALQLGGMLKTAEGGGPARPPVITRSVREHIKTTIYKEDERYACKAAHP